MSNLLFSTVSVGPYRLRNRMVMAPLTRCRSTQPGNVPNRLNAAYYAQRASAGLIVSEATQIAPEGQGYPWTPGIHSAEQIEGWRGVTEAVHEVGGLIFMQLWHVGRISHPTLQPGGGLPVAPSAIQPTGQAFVADGQGGVEFVPFVTPRALENREISEIIQQYGEAATRAIEAGMDGVEVHAANGYLIDQFLNSTTNHRTDEYGGSIPNRTRFLLEVVRETIRQIGPGRVGVRLSPLGTFNDMGDEEPEGLFAYLAEQLNGLDIAYLHVVNPEVAGNMDLAKPDPRSDSILRMIRQRYEGVLILCGGYTKRQAEEAIEQGQADLVAFGRLFLANPDLTVRFAEEASLNVPDQATFYGGGAAGYLDYPTLAQQRGQEPMPDFHALLEH